jgi:uncharacterized protein (TIGR02996 family)
MTSTLAALEAAINANPADRTVRLVLADALDEVGDPAGAARAAFIRAQSELEATPEGDPRRGELASPCRELFAEHWIDWWRPVCAALDLPEPHVPGRTVGARLKRLLARDARPPGTPYVAHPHACSVESRDLAFTAQFIAGFPELLAIHDFTSDTITGQFRAFFARAPFHRLRLTRDVSEFEWDRLDGPHIARLTELTVDEVTREFASRLLRSPLGGLTALRVGPLFRDAGVLRPLIHDPPWAGLRSLSLLQISPPGVIQTLAGDCTLASLEELSFEIGEVSSWLPLPGVAGAIGAMLGALHAQLANLFGPPRAVTSADYWPALQALAESPLLRQLRRLRVVDAHADLLDRAAGTVLLPAEIGSGPEALLPDALVNALAGGLAPDKLERLELPATRLSPTSRAALAGRFGPRFVAS